MFRGGDIGSVIGAELGDGHALRLEIRPPYLWARVWIVIDPYTMRIVEIRRTKSRKPEDEETAFEDAPLRFTFSNETELEEADPDLFQVSAGELDRLKAEGYELQPTPEE